MATLTQVNLFRTWKDCNLTLKTDSTVLMKDLYDNYVHWIALRSPGESKLSLPIRAKTFATLMKKQYLHEEPSDAVMFFYRDGSQVAGISIREENDVTR